MWTVLLDDELKALGMSASELTKKLVMRRTGLSRSYEANGSFFMSLISPVRKSRP